MAWLHARSVIALGITIATLSCSPLVAPPVDAVDSVPLDPASVDGDAPPLDPVDVPDVAGAPHAASTNAHITSATQNVRFMFLCSFVYVERAPTTLADNHAVHPILL
jgi:hypothetical protein